MKKFIISILVLSTAITSCSTDLDINRDPDLLDPDKAPLSSQLPAGIAGLAGSEGATYAILGDFGHNIGHKVTPPTNIKILTIMPWVLQTTTLDGMVCTMHWVISVT